MLAVGNDEQGGKEAACRRRLLPYYLLNAVGVALYQAGGVGAGNAVYLDSCAACDEAEYVVPENGIAAGRHLVIQSLDIPRVKHQNVFAVSGVAGDLFLYDVLLLYLRLFA